MLMIKQLKKILPERDLVALIGHKLNTNPQCALEVKTDNSTKGWSRKKTLTQDVEGDFFPLYSAAVSHIQSAKSSLGSQVQERYGHTGASPMKDGHD